MAVKVRKPSIPELLETELFAVASPQKVPMALRRTADQYRASHDNLVSAWQDPKAGAIWKKIATALDRTANSIDRLLSKES